MCSLPALYNYPATNYHEHLPPHLPAPPIDDLGSTTSTQAGMAQSPADEHHRSNKTFASQRKLPKLPIPDLEDTCRRYLRALEGLQDKNEHEATERAVDDFLHGEGPHIQERLKAWASTKDS
jgi:Choline/Carnitine o-acyltransferase